MTEDELRRYKAECIDKMHTDPVKRMQAHQYQNRLNGMLESLSYEERIAVIVDMMNENVETLTEQVKKIKELI